jgi:Fe-S cluster assembly scaffold protein SufB
MNALEAKELQENILSQLTVPQVNVLPAPTWKHLGVNAATFPVLDNVGGSRKVLPESFKALATGMGPAAEQFVLDHCTELHLVEIPAGKQAELVTLGHTLGSGEYVGDVTLIHARAGSSVTVLQSYVGTEQAKPKMKNILAEETARAAKNVSASGGQAAAKIAAPQLLPAQHAGLTKIIAEAGATVRLFQVQMLDRQSHHFSDVGIALGAGAKVEVYQAELGGAQAFAGCRAELSGERSNFTADTVYFGDGSRKLDLNYVARHTGRKTKSTMRAAGALFAGSDKIYRGTLDFRNGAAKAVGHETEETLLFSPDARNRTVPLILCDEEDVEGQHAATIGRMSPARQFYLQSRGLSEAQIKQLAVEAMFAPLVDKLPDEKLRQQVRVFLGRSIAID